MSSPKVSVLVPTYNAGPFLAVCLESILAQDLTDYEVLISDDGSTDGSQAIIESYAAKDPRIRWWRNPQNLGLTRNHNYCLREARGEFIKFVHQDDKLLHPSVLSRMVKLLEEDATVSLVGLGSNVIDAQSCVLEVRNHFKESGTYDGMDIIVKCLEENQNLIGEPTAVMFRKSQAARGFDERYRQIVDMECWFHLLEQGRFAYVAEPLFAFRVHPQQATQKHKVENVAEEEQLLLFKDYLHKPWLKFHATRLMRFRQIYFIRKNYGARGRELVVDAMLELKPFWYGVYWTTRKVCNPFIKLKRRIARYLSR